MALAARARGLRPPAPDDGTGQRLRRDFAQYRETLPPPAFVRWLRRWAGVGPAPRPLVERLAAGAILLSALGGGTGVAAQGGWQEAYGLARNIVTNLNPGDGPAGAPPVATVSPSPAPTTPTPSPSPTPGPAATPSPTAVPADADPTADAGDDSGGSDNSGRGGGTVEPGDDNGGSSGSGD